MNIYTYLGRISSSNMMCIYDRTRAYTITGAPRVAKGKVYIGNGGAEYGVRGYVTAYDSESGDQVWRFYTVPGSIRMANFRRIT